MFDSEPQANKSHERQQRRAEALAADRCPNCQWLTYQCNCADHPDA